MTGSWFLICLLIMVENYLKMNKCQKKAIYIKWERHMHIIAMGGTLGFVVAVPSGDPIVG